MTAAEAARRSRLVAKHGRPARFPDAAGALRLLGRRGDVHPHDVMAFVYRDQEAAAAFAASNLEHAGVPSLGAVPVDGGVLGVLDFRAVLAGRAEQTGLSWERTDPALPDDWVPPQAGGYRRG